MNGGHAVRKQGRTAHMQKILCSVGKKSLQGSQKSLLKEPTRGSENFSKNSGPWGTLLYKKHKKYLFKFFCRM